jgi:hypothetical protein
MPIEGQADFAKIDYLSADQLFLEYEYYQQASSEDIPQTFEAWIAHGLYSSKALIRLDTIVLVEPMVWTNDPYHKLFERDLDCTMLQLETGVTRYIQKPFKEIENLLLNS